MMLEDTVLERYQIEDLIGVGGEATVALAVDLQTGQYVAVKKLEASPEHPHFATFVARLQRAARLHINHPAVVNPIDYGEEADTHYLIMPYVEGDPLDVHVSKQGGRLPVPPVFEIAKVLADALIATHAQGIVHRDLKPGNVIIRPDGQPAIIDWGICRLLHEATLTKGSGLLGTLTWMAPEQLNCPTTVDERADLYSLGALIYYMASGATPIDGDTPEARMQNVYHQIPAPLRRLNPRMPLHLEQLCIRLLAKDFEQRPKNAKEVFNELSDSSLPVASACLSCKALAAAGGQFCSTCGAPLNLNGNGDAKCLPCGAAVAHDSSCPGCHRRFSPEDHLLEFVAGALAGEKRRIPEGIYVVGRTELLPRDMRISRRQFHVACSNGAVQIQDASSTNKTYVAQRPAEHPTLLVPGQEIVIAGNVAIYRKD